MQRIKCSTIRQEILYESNYESNSTVFEGLEKRTTSVCEPMACFDSFAKRGSNFFERPNRPKQS